MQLRTPYNYDREEVSKNTALICPEPTLAQQNMKDETDLNIMIRKYGVLPASEVNWKDFDATIIPKDYHALRNMIKEADQAFLDLPAGLRAECDNDQEKFLMMLNEKQAEIRKQEKHAAKAAAEVGDRPGQSPVPESNEADKPAE